MRFPKVRASHMIGLVVAVIIAAAAAFADAITEQYNKYFGEEEKQHEAEPSAQPGPVELDAKYDPINDHWYVATYPDDGG